MVREIQIEGTLPRWDKARHGARAGPVRRNACYNGIVFY
jgi:hypothetical protein